MIRILHTADLHLDSPFQGLDREKALLRRREQRELLCRIAALAKERTVDLILLAGDLFDSDDPFSDTAALVGQTLSETGLPVFIAPGNHDRYTETSPWEKLNLGDNVHIFKDESIQYKYLPALSVRVWGSAFTRSERSAPLRNFEAEKDGDTLDIMVLHGQVGDPNSPYAPISEEDIARSGMDYIALGHVHTASGLRKAGNTYYAWSGCPEGRGFDECGEKGVYLVELERDGCHAEFIPLGGRKYERLEIDLTEAPDALTAVEQSLSGDTSRDVYRIYLTGQTPTPPDTEALQRTLENRFFALEIRDRTTPCRELWDGMERNTLRGLFLLRMREKLDKAANDTERALILQAVRYGIAAMDNGDEPGL